MKDANVPCEEDFGGPPKSARQRRALPNRYEIFGLGGGAGVADEPEAGAPDARHRVPAGRGGIFAALLVLILLPAGWTAGAASETHLPPAVLKISGYGLLGNLRLARMVRLLEFSGKKPPPFFDANFIEDSVLILTKRLHDDGHLEPVITADITLENGRKLRQVFRQAVGAPLPRGLRARAVRFVIRPGVLYHYTRIEFTGLRAIPAKRARAYFIETSGIIPLAANRVYSPSRLTHSMSNLREALERLGFKDATVSATHLRRDDRTGRVRVEIQVNQGPKFLVRSVRQEVYFGNAPKPSAVRTNELTRVYSAWWEQDYIQSVKTNYFQQGYPETAVTMSTLRRTPSTGEVFLDLRAVVRPGPRVRAGKILFVGSRHTRRSALAARVPLKPGAWLDPVKAEEGQYRISRLGVFESVELNYEPVTSNRWNVTYNLKEGKRTAVSLLFGIGSYDLLRGGVELDQYNLWGLAHSQRLRLVQSFKSSSGDYTYTIPEVFGRDADFFLKATGLRRQEISFIRQEYGGGAGLHKLFHRISTDTSLRYNYGILEATEASINFLPLGAQSPTVGEFIADVGQDRRDNPLYPHKGYQLLGSFELASPYLGGSANFQRLDLGASYHLPLNDSEWLHLNLRHGVVATLGGTRQNLPFVRRFFPGGEDSVRGYPEGEAAPRNAQGQIVGAETYTSGTVEFEQALTPRWSVVMFVDGVEFAQQLADYPGNEALFSAGGGLSLRTVIGPLRLEYGYNLNPRPQDPMGTLQFSLGVPF